MKIHPSTKIIVCKSTTETTSAGLDMVNSKKEKPEVGIVVKIGTGKLPMKVKVGDKIVFRRYTDNVVQLSDGAYNFIRFEDLLAVLR